LAVRSTSSLEHSRFALGESDRFLLERTPANTLDGGSPHGRRRCASGGSCASGAGAGADASVDYNSDSFLFQFSVSRHEKDEEAHRHQHQHPQHPPSHPQQDRHRHAHQMSSLPPLQASPMMAVPPSPSAAVPPTPALPPPMSMTPSAGEGTVDAGDEQRDTDDDLPQGRVAVVSRDRRRLLVDVTQAISSIDAVSILEVHTQSHKNGLATMQFVMQSSAEDLVAIVEAVKRVDGVQQAFELQA